MLDPKEEENYQLDEKNYDRYNRGTRASLVIIGLVFVISAIYAALFFKPILLLGLALQIALWLIVFIPYWRIRNEKKGKSREWLKNMQKGAEIQKQIEEREK